MQCCFGKLENCFPQNDLSEINLSLQINLIALDVFIAFGNKVRLKLDESLSSHKNSRREV